MLWIVILSLRGETPVKEPRRFKPIFIDLSPGLEAASHICALHFRATCGLLSYPRVFSLEKTTRFFDLIFFITVLVRFDGVWGGLYALCQIRYHPFMDKKTLEHFKLRLIEERGRLEAELNDIGHADPLQKDSFTADYQESGSNSEDDNAQEIAEYADDLSIEARLEAELKDVSKALESVDKGTYGTCKYCNKEIDEKRLEARPASSSCIECKKILTQEM